MYSNIYIPKHGGLKKLIKINHTDYLQLEILLFVKYIQV
jgi:hypothetical protein